MKEVQRRIAFLEDTLKKAEQRNATYSNEQTAALEQYEKLRTQVENVDQAALEKARSAIRPDMEREAYQMVQTAYGRNYNSRLMSQSTREINDLLDDEDSPHSLSRELYQGMSKTTSRILQEQKRPGVQAR